MLRVGYQGVPGAFSENAIAVFWDAVSVTSVPLPDFESAVAALDRGAVDAAVLPVENTRMGIITDCIGALLRRKALRVLRETDISVHHHLLALPGASLEGLERVESHPAALAQCRDWLARHPQWRVVVVSDTAAAARDVASSGDWTRAAIASAAAGARYGLSVLAWNLQDDPQNRTRFWAVARAGSGAPEPERAPGVRDLGGIPVEVAVARLRAESVPWREDGGPRRTMPGALSAGGRGHMEGGS